MGACLRRSLILRVSPAVWVPVALLALASEVGVVVGQGAADSREGALSNEILRVSPVLGCLEGDAAPGVFVEGTSGGSEGLPLGAGGTHDPPNRGTEESFLAPRGGSEYYFAGGEIASSPKPIHLEGDANPGIVFGTSLGEIYVLRADGSVASGWPVTTGSLVGYTSAAVADLTGNDAEDIVFHTNNSLEAYAQNGAPLPGWPQALDGGVGGNSIVGSPVVADIDMDGDPEIMVGHFQRMYAFHHDGSLVDGWPVAQAHVFGPLFSTPAVGDVDGDGDAEICFKIYGGNGDPADVYLLHHDGTNVAGWPKLGLDRSHLSSPILADVDNDSNLDVVVSLHFFDGGNYVRLYVWKSDGSDVPGFPVDGSWNTAPENQSVGDVDDDGRLEIFVSTSNYTSPHYAIHAWNHDGTALAGTWPRPAPLCLLSGSPALADINGGLNEIVVGVGGCYVDDNGFMNAWSVDGGVLPSWPRSVSGQLRSSPLVMDGDLDGAPEIYVGSSNGWIHRFLTEDTGLGAHPEWGQIFHDQRNTNRYGPSGASSVADGDSEASPRGAALVLLRPNPFREAVTIRYAVPVPGDVAVSVFNVQGHKVADLARGPHPPGTHVVTWRGFNTLGKRAGAGVYFVKIESGHDVASHSVTLLR